MLKNHSGLSEVSRPESLQPILKQSFKPAEQNVTSAGEIGEPVTVPAGTSFLDLSSLRLRVWPIPGVNLLVPDPNSIDTISVADNNLVFDANAARFFEFFAKSVIEVNLNGCNLHEIAAECLKCLYRLRRLYVENNKLDAILPRITDIFPDIKSVFMDGNPMRAFPHPTDSLKPLHVHYLASKAPVAQGYDLLRISSDMVNLNAVDWNTMRVIVLGDPCSGKTSFINTLLGLPAPDPAKKQVTAPFRSIRGRGIDELHAMTFNMYEFDYRVASKTPLPKLFCTPKTVFVIMFEIAEVGIMQETVSFWMSTVIEPAMQLLGCDDPNIILVGTFLNRYIQEGHTKEEAVQRVERIIPTLKFPPVKSMCVDFTDQKTMKNIIDPALWKSLRPQRYSNGFSAGFARYVQSLGYNKEMYTVEELYKMAVHCGLPKESGFQGRKALFRYPFEGDQNNPFFCQALYLMHESGIFILMPYLANKKRVAFVSPSMLGDIVLSLTWNSELVPKDKPVSARTLMKLWKRSRLDPAKYPLLEVAEYYGILTTNSKRGGDLDTPRWVRKWDYDKGCNITTDMTRFVHPLFNTDKKLSFHLGHSRTLSPPKEIASWEDSDTEDIDSEEEFVLSKHPDRSQSAPILRSFELLRCGSAEEDPSERFEQRPFEITCGDIINDGKVYTGTNNGFVIEWDPKNPEAKRYFPVSAALFEPPKGHLKDMMFDRHLVVTAILGQSFANKSETLWIATDEGKCGIIRVWEPKRGALIRTVGALRMVLPNMADNLMPPCALVPVGTTIWALCPVKKTNNEMLGLATERETAKMTRLMRSGAIVVYDAVNLCQATTIMIPDGGPMCAVYSEPHKRVFVGTASGAILNIDPVDGSVKRRYNALSREAVLSLCVVGGDIWYVSESTNEVKVLNCELGKSRTINRQPGHIPFQSDTPQDYFSSTVLLPHPLTGNVVVGGGCDSVLWLWDGNERQTLQPAVNLTPGISVTRKQREFLSENEKNAIAPDLNRHPVKWIAHKDNLIVTSTVQESAHCPRKCALHLVTCPKPVETPLTFQSSSRHWMLNINREILADPDVQDVLDQYTKSVLFNEAQHQRDQVDKTGIAMRLFGFFFMHFFAEFMTASRICSIAKAKFGVDLDIVLPLNRDKPVYIPVRIFDDMPFLYQQEICDHADTLSFTLSVVFKDHLQELTSRDCKIFASALVYIIVSAFSDKAFVANREKGLLSRLALIAVFSYSVNDDSVIQPAKVGDKWIDMQIPKRCGITTDDNKHYIRKDSFDATYGFANASSELAEFLGWTLTD